MIGVTQPRRIAAMSVCEWVAHLHGSDVGRTIGYQIRQDRALSDTTRVKFMTEGILLRELHGDPSLKRYSVVVVDEAHERGVNQDLILGLLKRLLPKRPDLKVVVMSATIDEERFATFFGGAPILRVQGRLFPVEVNYANDTPYNLSKMVTACAEKIVELVRKSHGDILAFMPDERSIKQVCEQVEKAVGRAVRVLPLYGAQAPWEQKQVFEMNGGRRVIVATNIAETSLTIEGVRHVVDCGLIKSMEYVSASMSSLQVVDHSQAGCEQRRGRAGRTQPGVCHRLFTKGDFEARPAYTEPEIKRMALDAVLLHLRVLGFSMDEVLSLELMDDPGKVRWQEAADRLAMLGAIDEKGEVTDDGRRMEALPVAPMLARMLLASEKYGCVADVATIVAGLTARNVFVRPRDKEKEADEAHSRFKIASSDALTVMNVWQQWRETSEDSYWARDNYLSARALRDIDRNREQLIEIMAHNGAEIGSAADPETVLKAVAAGLIVNLAIMGGGFSYNWQGDEIYIHPGSAMFGDKSPRMIVCAEVVETTKPFARGVSTMKKEWIGELIPAHLLKMEYRVEELVGRPKLMRTSSWHGTMIETCEVDELDDRGRNHLAEQFVKMTTQTFGATFYPMHRTLKEQGREVLAARGLRQSFYGSIDDLASVSEELKRYFLRKLAGVATFSELLATDMTLRVEEWLTEEARAAKALQEVEKAELEAERRQYEEVRRREIAVRMAPLKEEFAPLKARVDALPPKNRRSVISTPMRLLR